MTARRIAAALAIVTLAATSACTSSGAGKNGKSASTAGKGNGIPVSKAPTGTPVDPATISARLKAGVASIRSAHVEVVIDAAGQKINVSGDEKLQGGQVQSVQVSSRSIAGSAPVQIIVVGGRTYAKLPKSVNKTGKPFVLVTKQSKNSTIRQLAASIDFSLGSVSLDRSAALVDAAKSASLIGKATISGTPTTRYSVTVTTQKLADDFPGKALLISAGLTTLPVDLYLDSAGRPVQISQAVKLGGRAVSVKISASKYNQPITIAAPPASQVGTA